MFLIKIKFKSLKNKKLLPGRINAFYVVPASFESLIVSKLSDHKMKNFNKISILREKSFKKKFLWEALFHIFLVLQ